ncbi:hypothetical protein [Terrimonas alba]|uniref:hypothetical protein n=1 Tax=Terrimonas alba TaxID=3349636 RepID=UPI0035F2882B
MKSEVIRFMTLRSIRSTNFQSKLRTVPLLRTDDEPVNDRLNKAGIINVQRSKILTGAKKYMASSDYYHDLSQINPVLKNLMNWINAQDEIPKSSAILTQVSTLFPGGIQDLIASSDFQRDRVNIIVSLIVASAVPNGKSTSRQQLLIAFKTIAALEAIAKNTDMNDFEALLGRTVILPESIFPIFFDNNKNAQRKRQEAIDRNRKEEEQNKLTIKNIITQIHNNIAAAEELTTAHEKHVNFMKRQPLPKLVPVLATSDALDSLTDIEKMSTGTTTQPVSTFLPADIVSKISHTTKTTLEKYNIEHDTIDVPQARARITEQNKILTSQLHSLQGPNAGITFIGNTPVLVKPARNATMAVATDRLFTVVPGLCPEGPDPQSEDLATEKWNTKGISPVLYIGDLQKVRQTVDRYELGDIAHIENVLKGELKSNELRRLDKTIETIIVETETTNETEKDLQTQEQFNLQTQANKTISSDRSFDAGITISGSYGPSLTATATANVSLQNSSEQSTQTSTNYAKEVISKAAQKIKERVLNNRTTTNIEKVKIINKHELNNTNGTDHVRGIYQWVNKIYQLQVMNYGKRAMLEFTIPDPAAFYRYALTTKPLEENTIPKPEEPGYCLNGVFQPLKASDISELNYQYWASKYETTEIKPYPDETKVLFWNTSINIEQSSTKSPHKLSQDAAAPITVPEGYTVDLLEFWLTIMRNDYHATAKEDQMEVTVMIGNIEIAHLGVSEYNRDRFLIPYPQTFRSNHPFPYFNDQAESLPVSIAGFSTFATSVNMGVKIICKLDAQTKEQWQLDTLNSIMNAYKTQKVEFDHAMKAKQFDNLVSIQGRNPFLNRETEKTELKKSVLSQLTGQDYTYFNSMKYNSPPLQYPEMDLTDAEDEGNYIRFFEQSFEWENMTYLFYPYFWASKKNWPMMLQLKDSDRLFEKFLQAGSARVQVPIRTGFEAPVLNYIQNGGTPWLFDDAPQVDGSPNAPFLSMIDEIKAQRGFEFNESNPGTVTVTNGSNVVTGFGTNFRPHDPEGLIDDENREIILLGKSYRIQSVTSSTSIILRQNYNGETQSGIGYYLGAKFVGEFWEELVPTELLYLKEILAGLNS